jgi:molybdopterin synthase catalytic subunit
MATVKRSAAKGKSKVRAPAPGIVEITTRRINVGNVVESVRDPSAGGVDIFIGTTRNNSGNREVLSMEYNAYVPMALKMMKELAERVRSTWDIRKISIVHRIGHLKIGEPSVVIAVSAAHRKEAFEACRFTIDTLKESVPIWKKEVFRDGEAWVRGNS